MSNKVIRENDFDCSSIEVTRLPHRLGYSIMFLARLNGNPVGETHTFDQRQIRLLGMKQAKYIVVDTLLARLNGAKI